MKKAISLLLCLILIFSFTGCKNNASEDNYDSSTEIEENEGKAIESEEANSDDVENEDVDNQDVDNEDADSEDVIDDDEEKEDSEDVINKEEDNDDGYIDYSFNIGNPDATNYFDRNELEIGQKIGSMEVVGFEEAHGGIIVDFTGEVEVTGTFEHYIETNNGLEVIYIRPDLESSKNLPMLIDDAYCGFIIANMDEYREFFGELESTGTVTLRIDSYSLVRVAAEGHSNAKLLEIKEIEFDK